MVVCPVAGLDDGATAGPRLVVIGCGCLNRSDDAAGVHAIRRLREHFEAALPAGVELFDAGTGGIEVMFKARGADALTIVDACSSGADAGAVFRLPGAEIGTAHQPAYSLHDFRWDHAVHAGRRMFGDAFPDRLTVYLIEAGSLSLGLELTSEVTAAVETVCRHVAAEIDRFAAAAVA
jgi:hydrogenase maturation protease